MKLPITTGRLIIRRYAEKNLNDLYEYLCDEEIMRFEPYNALSFEETKKSLEWRISSDEIFAIELKSLQNDWKRLSWETRLRPAGRRRKTVIST